MATVYANNLNDHIKKEELRRSLYFLFSTYGSILDVVALKTEKMRGQAFIVFEERDAAEAAMRALNGFVIFDKPMRLTEAKSKSDVFKKLDGTYVHPLVAKEAERKAQKIQAHSTA